MGKLLTVLATFGTYKQISPLPCKFGVLTVKNYEQAMARANSKGDKDAGGKAALSCLRMIEISRQYSSLTI